MQLLRDRARQVVKPRLYSIVKILLNISRQVSAFAPNKVVFISSPDAADNAWHLYRFMCAYLEGKHFVWLCVDPNSVRQRVLECAKESGNTVTVETVKSVSGMRDYISASFVFLTHGLPAFLPRAPSAVVVNLWHGMPIKPIGLLNKNDPKTYSVFDYILSTSPFYTSIMAQAFKVSRSQVIEFGLPRNDTLLSPSSEIRSLLATKLDLSSEKRIVFWLPTYRTPQDRNKPDDSYDENFLDDWDDGFLERLDNFSEELDCVIIIKIHPLDSLNGKIFKENLNNIRLVSSQRWERLEIDLYDALAISSALITDLSSVLIDYAVTGHPIAVTKQSYSKYFRGMIEGTGRILDGCYAIDNEPSFFRFLISIDKNESFDTIPLREFNTQASTRQSACRYLLDALEMSS